VRLSRGWDPHEDPSPFRFEANANPKISNQRGLGRGRRRRRSAERFRNRAGATPSGSLLPPFYDVIIETECREGNEEP
jgi:hypothetical protein